MKKIQILIYSILIISNFCYSQSNLSSNMDENDKQFKEKENIPIELDTVLYYPGITREYKAVDLNYYYWLQKKIFKVYPYYIKAVTEYQNLKNLEKQGKSNAEIHKISKQRQKELADEYEKQLRKLTRTEGRIFIKLLHKKTNKTTYQIIKELRGSWNVFWWNLKAGFFNVDLKATFDPKNNTEDLYIESIIRKGIREGYLQKI